MILILVLLDILVMSLWVGVDTPEIVTMNLESQVSIACKPLAVFAIYIFLGQLHNLDI